jgi:hypothetical protein
MLLVIYEFHDNPRSESCNLSDKLISGYVVKNTTMYVQIDVVFLITKKLHVSFSSGHHQVLPRKQLRLFLYNSRDSVLMNRSQHQTPVKE